MKQYVTTDEIFLASTTLENNFGVDDAPSMSEWHYGTEISVDKIRYWETVYYQPGSLGIYAAHDPYVEYYILVPDFFLENIEIYYGMNASIKVHERARQIGINLELGTSWIPLEKMLTPS